MTADQEPTVQLAVVHPLPGLAVASPTASRASLVRRSARAAGVGGWSLIVWTARGVARAVAEWARWVWQPELATTVEALSAESARIRADLKAAKRARASVEELGALRDAAYAVAAEFEQKRSDLRKGRSGRLFVTVAGPVAALFWIGPALAFEHDVSMTWVYAGTAVVALVALAVTGRLVTDRTPDEDDDGADVQALRVVESNPDDPFPLADARNRREVQECFRRALTSDLVKAVVLSMEEPSRYPWGAEQAVVAHTPITDKLDAIERLMDLRPNGLLVQQDPNRRARLILRAIERDPFRDMPPLRVAAPDSLSILDPLHVGQRIDGSPLLLELCGVHTLVVAQTRGGKSIAALSMGERITACRDAVLWDVDVFKDGLDELGDTVSRKARTNAEAEELLTDALLYAKVRPGIRRGLGMGRSWDVSAEFPQVTVVIDEFPRLSDQAKSLVHQIQATGAGSCVTLIILSQQGVQRSLGTAMAQEFGLRITLPSRDADIPIVLGGGMKEQGWRPDRLQPATPTDPYDAGSGYVLGGRNAEPILVKFAQLTEADAARVGPQRAGTRPRVDTATVSAARALRATGAVPAAEEPNPVLDLLAVMGDGDRITSEEAVAALRAAFPDRHAEVTQDSLADLLRPYGVAPRSVRISPTQTPKGYMRVWLEGAV